MKRRKDAAEAKAERKRKRKAAHDKARQLARAEGKPRPATPESSEEDEEESSDAEDHALRSDGGARGAEGRSWVIGESLPRGCGAGVIPAGGRRGDARSPGADPWRRGCGGRGVVRAGSLEPPGRHEGGALGAVFEGRHDAPGSKERHEEVEHECSVWVSTLYFVFVTSWVDFSILLSSTRVSWFLAPRPFPKMRCSLPRP